MAQDGHVRYVTLMAPWRTKDVAEYLGVTERTVKNYQRQGLLPAEKVGDIVFFNPYEVAKRVGCAE